MYLSAGSKLGSYQIIGQLGAGGMGEVYRARDLKLDRDVAVKFLHSQFVSDPERLERFQREARALASLNHPNITSIYGLEEFATVEGSQFALVMELVEGPTLAERISLGPIPANEALPIAEKIVDALDAAHERGIIHRDLKPANIKVTEDGEVKVLDFGLAKFYSDDSPAGDITNSPTLIQGTQSGVILGTAAYMSPEQAKGKTVDKRSDIWAFGCVLYEMLTGHQCFDGETLTDVLASVIRSEPDLSKLPGSTPNKVKTLLARCLTKDTRKRLRDIGDARLLLELDSVSTTPGATGVLPRWPAWWLASAAALLVLVAGVLGAFAYRLFLPKAAQAPTLRYSFSFPSDLANHGGSRNRIAISPDGTRIAYAANNRLYLRYLNSLTSTEVSGVTGAESPVFSPDGSWIAYLHVGDLMKISVNGGPPIQIGTRVGAPASWSLRDEILCEGNGKIYLVSAKAGSVITLTELNRQSRSYADPQLFPDGKSFFYTQMATSGEVQLVARTIDKGEETVVFTGNGADFRYVSSGHLLFTRKPATGGGMTLFAIPFDVSALKVRGTATPIISDVDYSGPAGMANFAVSSSGTIAYIAGSPSDVTGTRLVMVSRSGEEKPLPIERRSYSDPRVSPDGRSLATHLEGDQDDIWAVDLARGTFSRISSDPGEDETPAWSQSGKWLAWASTRQGTNRSIFRRASDGSGGEQLIWKLEKHAHVRDWLPDENTIVLETLSFDDGGDIEILKLDGTPRLFPYLKTKFTERSSRVSPDGKWIAYVSDESGRDEIYIQSFPEPGNRVVVTSNSGDQPVWARDGKRLFFRAGGFIQEVEFQAQPVPRVGPPKQLFKDHFSNPQGRGHTGFDAMPDGRLLMIKPEFDENGKEEIIVIHNWFAELKSRIP